MRWEPVLDLYGRRRDGSEFPLKSVSARSRTSGEHRRRRHSRCDEAQASGKQNCSWPATPSKPCANSRAGPTKAGRRFLDAAGRELRQPLQTLALRNEDLRRHVSGAAALEALSQQEQAISTMSRLLNDLFDIGNLDSGAVISPQPTDFELAGGATRTAGGIHRIAADKGLRFEIGSCDGVVRSDPEFGAQDVEKSCFKCHPLHPRGSSASALPARSGRSSHRSTRYRHWRAGRLWMGLNIVKRLAHLLKLELQVRSEEGRGSAFSIVLPAVTAVLKSGPDAA